MPPKAYTYWEWQTDSGAVKAFAKDDSISLEKQYRIYSSAKKDMGTTAAYSLSGAIITIAGQSYMFDLENMTQTNAATGTSRRIYRIAPTGKGDGAAIVAAALAPVPATADQPVTPAQADHHYVWEWGQHGHFTGYDPLISTKIETAFKNDALVLDIGSVPISAHDTANVKIHFGHMQQINKETDVTRPIRRIRKEGPPPALFSAPPVAKPFNGKFEANADDKADLKTSASQDGSDGKSGNKRARDPPTSASDGKDRSASSSQK